MTNTTTPGSARTAAARAKVMRNAQQRRATRLAGDGWFCFPPDVPDDVRMLLQRIPGLIGDDNAPLAE